MQIRAIAMLALSSVVMAAPAAAQRLGPQQLPPPPPGAPQVHTLNQLPPAPLPPRAPRWGGRIDGRWEGGARAPGGWRAYRRPVRGWTLPRYWIAPNFVIADYAYYGLATPGYGYNWVRYYDDAVMVDGRGRVIETAGGIDWDRYDGGYAQDYRDDRGDPRYRRGAPGGYPGYGADYAPPPPAVVYAQPQAVVQPLPPGGYTQTYSAGGYASGVWVNGQWYPAPAPGGVSTVTVQSAPVVTTTVTEYVTARRVVYRKVWRKPVRKVVRKWRPKPRCGCQVMGS